MTLVKNNDLIFSVQVDKLMLIRFVFTSGNIRVFCRVRPVCQEEAEADSKSVVSFDSDDDAVLYISNKGKLMTFDLDKVFPPHATQEEVRRSQQVQLHGLFI